MSSPCGGIHPRAVIGEPPEHRDYRALSLTWFPPLPPVIHPTALIEALAHVDSGVFRCTEIGARSWIMKGVHVGHDTRIGTDVEIAPNSSIGGECVIGDGVHIGQCAVTVPRITIGPGARIGAGAVVTKNVPAGETWVGNPADEIGKQTRRRRMIDSLVAGQDPTAAAERDPHQAAGYVPDGWRTDSD